MNKAIELSTIQKALDFEQIPGWQAQKEMVPPGRTETHAHYMKPDVLYNAKKAEVLILLYESENEIKFPVILRKSYQGVHSAQMGLPGGKIEATDKQIADAAKRETEEEIGIDKNKVDILGALTPLYIPPSNFWVAPFVGIYKEKNPTFKKDPKEVETIYSLGLTKFVAKTPQQTLAIKNMEVPAFCPADTPPIWGATAMILNELSIFVKKCLYSHSPNR